MNKMQALAREKRAALDAAATRIVLKLRERRGDSNLASVIFITAVVIVIIAVIFFPALRDMVSGAFDKADGKLNDIWNFG